MAVVAGQLLLYRVFSGIHMNAIRHACVLHALNQSYEDLIIISKAPLIFPSRKTIALLVHNWKDLIEIDKAFYDCFI